jgi:hypothetical protein
MNNKTTIVIAICAAAALAFLSLYRFAKTQTASEQKIREPVNFTTADLETLKLIGNGLRSLNNEDAGARAALAKSGQRAMESFLKSWNPIGRTPQDLKALFGEPKEETPDFLLYSFDNGNYAWLYQFEIHNGEVAGLTRPKSE